MKILIFDNYDSFTYNLVHLTEKITGEKVEVRRNDEIPLEEVDAFDKIILSPGPGIPSEAGLLLPLIRQYAPTKSILGVCLGHQAIGEAFGGTLLNLTNVYHGVATPCLQLAGTAATGGPGTTEPSSKGSENGTATHLFSGLPEEFEVGRYHSWVVAEEGFPQELEITARDRQGMIMALRHKSYDVQGVQFHPESVLTPQGEVILRNWLKQ
ncbi:MAG TPA: aminodeoxychorismate/anthranilate synthase component II [Chitinophagaceae bacterium]|jgi:anthranilate synthase component 2|nr:aminodeoxychorismate/anthranilate synthase component II [Chitinophagaceae bacterium]